MSDSPDLAAIRATWHAWQRQTSGQWIDAHLSMAVRDVLALLEYADVQAERLARLENGQPAPTGIDALLTEAKAYMGGSFPLTPVHVQMARLVDALEAQVELRTRDQADLAAAHAALAQAVEQEELWENEADKARSEAAEQREALSWTIAWHGHILNCPGTTPGMSCLTRCAPTLAALAPPEPAS